MKANYTYCNNENTCIHRRGCKRWVGNYEDDYVEEVKHRLEFLDDSYCLDSTPYPFENLDRFRNSDGSEMKGTESD